MSNYFGTLISHILHSSSSYAIFVFCLTLFMHEQKYRRTLQMDHNLPTSFDDIDFQKLWEKARTKRSWSSKKENHWDKKADSFARRNRRSPYIDHVLKKLLFLPEQTVLDIGCGPGTLSLPIAQGVKKVTALDYSAKMLEILEKTAERKKIKNIHTVKCRWEDDWTKHNIFPHDICIASRSLNVPGLTDALIKINDFATKTVYLIDRITPTPFEPEIFEAVGRKFESGPDYIYTLSILYQLGIHPHVEIVSLDSQFSYESYDEMFNTYKWMLKETTEKEDSLLHTYLKNKSTTDENGQITIRRSQPSRWALISWNKELI